MTQVEAEEFATHMVKHLGQSDAMFVAEVAIKHGERFTMQMNATFTGRSVPWSEAARALLAIAKRLDAEGGALS